MPGNTADGERRASSTGIWRPGTTSPKPGQRRDQVKDTCAQYEMRRPRIAPWAALSERWPRRVLLPRYHWQVRLANRDLVGPHVVPRPEGAYATANVYAQAVVAGIDSGRIGH
jgi:hypothetical protein